MPYNSRMKKLNLKSYRNRRLLAVSVLVTALTGVIITNPNSYEQLFQQTTSADSVVPDSSNPSNTLLASTVLTKLTIKGRAPKTGYSREEFYSGWPEIEGCSLRQRIIKRELGENATLGDDNCTVVAGEFKEPYTGNHMTFHAKSDFSKNIQIDHVVALSDAWQKGAQYLSSETRYALATDPLNLLAVDSKTNQGKSDGDAATWLPPNKAFRCQYIARQISVKYKYNLWVTEAEHDAMARVLETCPHEPSVGIELKE